MKLSRKILMGMGILLTVFSLAGCGKEVDTESRRSSREKKETGSDEMIPESSTEEHTSGLSDMFSKLITQEDTNETLFRRYLSETLIPVHGVFLADQSGTMRDYEDKWLNPRGIIHVTIRDFDLDDQCEMLVCRTELSNNSEYYDVILEMYEAVEKEVVLNSVIPYEAYHERTSGRPGVPLSEAQWTEVAVCVNSLDADGKCYILCENYQLAAAFGDGSSRNYWALTYNGDQLQYAFSFTQTAGGSAGFEYTGYEFQDGIPIDAKLYYAEEYSDGEGNALYDEYSEALAAFFGAHNIIVREDIVQYQNIDKGYDTIFVPGDTEPMFKLLNQLAEADYIGNKYTFNMIVLSNGEALDGAEASTSQTGEMSEAYRRIYADILREKKGGSFRSIYVDADDIPELAYIAGNGAHLDQVSLYTIWDGQAVYLRDVGAYGELPYSEKNNRIFAYSGVEANEELEAKYTYMIENGTMVQAPDHKGYPVDHVGYYNAYENNEANIELFLAGELGAIQ